jgi:hypothetical protein
LDYHSWQRRTNSECRSFASRFEAAENEEARLFKQSGMRWSELLRLPYFDIVQCIVVDAMHNLFLGLIKEHFTGILGIALPRKQEDPVCSIVFSEPPAGFTENEKKSVERLKKWLAAPAATVFSHERELAIKKLKTLHTQALRFACDQFGCDLPTVDGNGTYSKDLLAGRILDWVCTSLYESTSAELAYQRLSQAENRETGADTSTRYGHVFTAEEMELIWSDMCMLLSPTWMTSVPSNLEEATHGKLKADQWRVLGTTYLPLSLIRLWGLTNTGSPRSRRCREILNLTMSLLSAVTVASSHSMSPALANSYLQHMQAYLAGLKKVFPEYGFHPNHHMALHLH